MDKVGLPRPIRGKVNVGLGRPLGQRLVLSPFGGTTMTHSLHRSGTVESLRGDYVWFMYQAKGINDKDIAPKAMEFIATAEAVGSEARGDVKSGSVLEFPWRRSRPG